MTPSLSHGYQVRCASFSRDGEWLATASVDGRVHVWDATTRRPLTPPLTIPTHKPSSVRFVKGDTAVFVTSDDGGAWLWPLELESRPLQNLVHLYELVCGRGGFEANRFRTTPQERLKETWINFSRKNSEDFKVSRAEILAWEASR